MGKIFAIPMKFCTIGREMFAILMENLFFSRASHILTIFVGNVAFVSQPCSMLRPKKKVFDWRNINK